MKLVFVHIPKAAGTSLKSVIVKKLGEDAVCFKYAAPPMSDGLIVRRSKCLIASLRGQKPEQSIIFGHFLVGKFARFTLHGFEKIPGLCYLTYLREPLQRAISHYHFWKRTYLGGHRVWDRFTRENWSLERFLLSPEHANFQSEFLWNFPLTNFDFVGISERYEESVAMLGLAFPELAGLEISTENSNRERVAGSSYQIDPVLAARFRQLNAQDYALYEEALAIFDEQRRRLGMESSRYA